MVDVSLLECCYDNGYRKCYNLVYWEVADECKSYDNYGSGSDGIANFLRNFDISIIHQGDKVVLDDHNRLYYYTNDISLIAKTLKKYSKIMGSIKTYMRTNALFFANVIDMNEGLATLKLLEALPIFQRHAPALMKIATIYKYTNPLELEKLAKQHLAEGRFIYGMLLTYYLGIRVSRTLPSNFIDTLLESPGMALTVAHEAAILLNASGPFTPCEIDEFAEILENLDTENQLVILMRLGYEYLSTARTLASYMNDGDYNNIKVYIDDSKLFMRLGAHMASAELTSSGIMVKYSDHDVNRSKILSAFLKRLGYNVSRNSGEVTIVVPFEKIGEVAKVLATTTSVDLIGCYNIYKKANNIEELLELRKQCV